MRTLTQALIFGTGVALAGWIGWGFYSSRTTKSVPYERLRSLHGVELRHYPQVTLVETRAANQRTAFRRLFNYISGANHDSESISMTAPVETQNGESVPMRSPVRSDSAASDADEVRMAFYLPADYGLETAPEPTDSCIALISEPPKTVAVDRFSWYAPEWRVRRRKRSLLSTLESEGIEPLGEPYLLRYNDPWTPPFMRRNEVAVEVPAET